MEAWARMRDGVTNFDSPYLHHLGGLSHVDDLERRRVARMMLRGPRSPLVNFVAHAARRASGSGRHRARVYQRKRQVLDYAVLLMDALRRGHRPPPSLETGSAEVDSRVRALAEALHEGYPRYRDPVQAITWA